MSTCRTFDSQVIKFSPDGAYVAVASDDKFVDFYR